MVIFESDCFVAIPTGRIYEEKYNELQKKIMKRSVQENLTGQIIPARRIITESKHGVVPRRVNVREKYWLNLKFDPFIARILR